MDPNTAFLVIVERSEPADPSSVSDAPRILGIRQGSLSLLTRNTPPRVRVGRRVQRRAIMPPFGNLTIMEECTYSMLLRVSSKILAKVPLYDDNSLPGQTPPHSDADIDRSFQRMHQEQYILDTVLSNPHPNIVAPLYITAQGTFLPILKECLIDRLHKDRQANTDTTPASQRLRLRWVNQIASALAWFESISYVHGSLESTHVMLDQNDNVKLISFGDSVSIGSSSSGTIHPYFPSWLLGGHSSKSEQWAFAWTVCEIYQEEGLEYYRIPSDTIDLDSYPFPSLDGPYASVIDRAWRLRHSSMLALSGEVKRVYDEHMPRLHRLAFAAKDARNSISERWRLARLTRQAEKKYIRLLRREAEILEFENWLARGHGSSGFD